MKTNFLTLLLAFAVTTVIAQTPSADSDTVSDAVQFGTDAYPIFFPERHCQLVRKDGVARVEAFGGEPILSRKFNLYCDNLNFGMRVRTETESKMVISWVSKHSPRRTDDKSITLDLINDGQWHNYPVALTVKDFLTGLSVKLTASSGLWEFDMQLIRKQVPHALTLRKVASEPVSADDPTVAKAVFSLYNGNRTDVVFSIRGMNKKLTLEQNRSLSLRVPVKPVGSLAAAALNVTPENFPPITYSAFFYRNDPATNWIQRQLSTPAATTPSNQQPLLFEVSQDGQVARVRQGETLLAIVAPICHRGGIIPSFKLIEPNGNEAGANSPIKFDAPDASLEINVRNDQIYFGIHAKNNDTAPATTEQTTSVQPSNKIAADATNADATKDGDDKDDTGKTAAVPPLEGPVIRPLGNLRAGLLPGYEYLRAGDVSTSPIDFAEPESRPSPSQHWITMPIMVLATDKVTAAVSWDEMTLLPALQSPNTIDGSDDHRMSLSGESVNTVVRFVAAEQSRDPIPDMLLWGLSQRPMPKPPALRDSAEQLALSMRAIDGVLQGNDKMSWSYAVEKDWSREPFSDVIASLWRARGKIPQVSSVVSGGSDIADDSAFFLLNKVDLWKSEMSQRAADIMEAMSGNGSFLCASRFSDVEKTQTSAGYCAVKTLQLLEWARYSGERATRDAALQAVTNLDKFDTPAGGFYRDTTLHTPDLLTAAYMCWSYTWTFEITNRPEYLAKARRWALCGLPFVYQWGDLPAMRYAAISRLGGTNRSAPYWYGTAQPQIGAIYAYSLVLLSQYDKTFDWRVPATGILSACEGMQYTTGEFAGCLPETYEIETQAKGGLKLAPYTIMTLRRAIEKKDFALHVASEGGDRVVSPYPITLNQDGAMITGVPKGEQVQVIWNGQAVINVEGNQSGKNQIPLPGKRTRGEQ
ncbi:MAG: hypothetical protein LBU65_06785 [Planctomycetaceae bacterium]|jgi:hypothetical protein|nr:hypothetical protein [Planctomycetaceae bacterium]